ncbi:2-phospho-L-lactate guanylyltransferase [Modestobacter sp. I12A-02662]|uniref:2-phospho-L-lactate guanylyltransferase n=1 Tax=Modestobacter sp. I12A-02662 TaxID=1730496 RepID=UPI0034DE40D6
MEWWVVVPAKRLAEAKTRLTPVTARLGPAAAGRHHELVLALLADTVAAAVDCPAVAGVLVVTDDPRAAAVVTALGARTVRDEPGAGLNPALAHGALAARAAGADAVAALNSDLPALRPAELAEALAAAAGHRRSFVADADGTGTTLLCVTAGELGPRYGPHSAAAHAAGGAVPLAGSWPGLRRDVDTPSDLRTAAALGVGPRTGQLLDVTCRTPG